ncbi:quaternary amine ABC transporter ATP-binding protein [Pararhizobium mangrovi]|uniref:quaternary amine ABC transporter ATP-binding protein n=1 Tax=Pararhizobium mangrovi TaxID=2590452 RepID=UPI001F195D40|nr:glycine betaine/L-proline ABC transporter ATP-binding protein [Pararhizobium mangrovi]
MDTALSQLENGETKETIFAETGMTVGVQDANFTVNEGEIFVIMGLSGSGKSTLVRMLNGLIEPSSGEILIDGDDVAKADTNKLRKIRRSKLAMVFQHFALFPHKTVADNVAYGLKVKGVGRSERRERALKALGQVGLRPHADTYTSELSGGMQQRVGLARGLATESDILLMDEPFSALDPLIRRDMQGELLELQRSLQKTIIFITHDLDEALILGDRIAIMKDGRIVQTGTARQIVDEPADDYVAAFTQDIDRARVLTAETAAVEPEALRYGEATVGEALRRMEELDRNALFVTDNGKPVGVVAYRDLVADGHDREAKLADERMCTDFPTVPHGTSLRDLYGFASSGLPIGIVSDEGKLDRVVEARALFGQLATSPEEEQAAAERSGHDPAQGQAATA